MFNQEKIDALIGCSGKNIKHIIEISDAQIDMCERLRHYVEK